MPQAKILAISLDMDGCIFNKKYEQALALSQEEGSYNKLNRLNAAVNSNQALIEDIKKRGKEEYSKIVSFVGSNRQDIDMDYTNSGINKTGSCLPVIQHLSQTVNAQLDTMLFADITHGHDFNHTFDAALTKLNDQLDYPNRAHDNTDMADKEELKFLLIYAQMHKLAQDNPDAQIDFEFYDDREDILNHLSNVCTNYPYLLPSNVRLCLKKYAGEQVDSYPLIQGCGGVNKNFAATIKNLNDEYRCKPENRDNFIDENGRPSPETVHGKVNPLVDLQLINTQQLLKKLNNLNINPKDKEAPLIRELQARLKHEITTYEQQIGLTLQNTTTLQFRQRCLTHIGIIDRKLNTQSSWRPFIKNLALAISVVGTPFALASFGKRLSQGHYAFFNDAKAHRQVGRLETIAAKIKAQQASTQQEVDSERQNKPPTR